MPVSTFLGIQTTLRGLLAQQRALDVTSHNIANANTEGYSRQIAVLAPSDPLTLPTSGSSSTGAAAQLGTGVDARAYSRVRDQFLDLQYRGQSMSLGEHTSRSSSLQQVELALAEPGQNGISATLGRFWNAWADLANSPESAAGRQAVIDQGRMVSESINGLQRSLADARVRAGAEYDALAGPDGDVARMTGDLAATLNAIRDAEMTGAQPNDLYDRRDLLLDRLSSFGQVSASASAAGGMDVTLGGVTIVDANDTTGVSSVPPGAFPLAFASSLGGRLGALLEMRDATGPIASFQADLDAVARSLSDAVNGIYSAMGTTFFTYGPGTGGLPVLAVDEPAINADSLRGGPAGAGDNSLALAIARLRGGDASERYGRLVTGIGNAVGDAKRSEATARVLTDNIKDRRDSVSGVSLDEEMTSLIRFQRAYQAAARAMSTTDEMLDTLINRAGRVGL
jgi:flagellar hook-associated protein 1 FlgK